MHSYIALKVNDAFPKTSCFLYRNGVPVSSFYAAVTDDDPCYTVYADIRRFGDGEYELRNADGDPVPFEFEDRFPSRDEIVSGKELRPVIHYTAPVGWLNDPNGLIYSGGRYHLFAQHNPLSRDWGNMTWIHAVSDDLFHWEDMGDAVFPDENGTVYSGSAVEDTENVSSLGKGTILLFYTAAGGTSEMSKGKPFTQCMAYSADGGNTFVKYGKNPVIGHIEAENRDPKVVYSEELGKWILALYLDRHDYRLFISDDLLNWTEWEDITMKTDGECPNFFPVEFEGERIWVFFGASDRYMLFRISDGKLVPVQDEESLYCARGGSYASQVFSGTYPEAVRLSWLHTDTRGAVFNSQMGFPSRMFLQREGGRIRLGCYPMVDGKGFSSESFEEVISGSSERMLISGEKCRGKAVCLEMTFPAACPDFELNILGVQIRVSPEGNSFSACGQEAPYMALIVIMQE